MLRYSYVAKEASGKIIRGFLSAENEIDLANKISNMGYFLTSFKSIADTASTRVQYRSGRLKPKDVLQFTFQLSTLLDAGLPLLEGLRDLSQTTTEKKLRNVLEDLRYRIESGSSLKEALAIHSGSFPALYTSIVGAGEATGRLGQSLQDLADMLEWQAELNAKMREAAIYPVILFIVMILVVTGLVVKVVPMFKTIFEQQEVALPLPTQIVLGVSDAVTHYGLWYAAGVAACVIGFKIMKTKPKGRFIIDTIKLKLPIFGDVIRKIALSRFTHTFSLGFRSGINLLTCLDIAKDTTANARMERAIGRARDSVNVGEKLAASLQATGEFPPMVIRMISVGEQSGSLANTLAKVASFYDKEVASTVKRMFAMFEPLMIVVMGLVVGGIAIAIFLPIFQMSQMVG